MKSNGKSIELVRALYSDTALIDSGIQLRRLNYNGKRNYFTITEENKIDRFYTSVTTFTKEVLPTGYGLQEWMKNKSKEEQDNILKSSATYGTLMDIFCNELLISGKVTDFEQRIMQHTLVEGIYYINSDLWCESLKKDVLAFAQFVSDYEVVPIMVSAPLKSDNFGLAGTMDLFCEMNSRIPTKTIKPERIKAIVDYKAKIGDMSFRSERNSFYESELLQLWSYGALLCENFPDFKIDGFCNFSPKNWRDKPSYNLKQWTPEQITRISEKFPLLLQCYRLDNEDKENTMIVFEDEIVMKDFSDSYRKIALDEFVNRNLAKEENQNG